MTHNHTNALIHASSPYLLQHAHNPVSWVEWSDAAFEQAKHEDKLVLVSIGYSACHWCHVMERECFEQEDTAAIMNENFICIKVDREERPDVDQLYMDAVQLLTGRGGWPLNCFVLPDGRPLHGGTYFPKHEWERVLQSLHQFYRNKKEEALEIAADLTRGIKQLDALTEVSTSGLFSKPELQTAMNRWLTKVDTQLGGYGWSPKFPMPSSWECMLQYGALTGENEFTDAAHLTLQRMANGGLFDQLGGGFARYSTDSFWKVPHFEKMLYDNAQLMGLYAKAYRHKPLPLYQKVVEQTHQFIQQELTGAEGLFYSALDADSEGVEGKYYVWTHAELCAVLEHDEPIFSLYYSVDKFGNWEDGVNILYKTRSDAELESVTGKSIAEIEATIENCRQKLLDIRDRRIAPGLDNKCITSWNALMIKGYAEAYKTFGKPAYFNAAKLATDALLEHVWIENKLYRIYKDGKVSIHGFAEDYANLCDALTALFEAGANENYLHYARLILESAISQFYNAESGLFYFTSHNDTPLVSRKTDTRDDVIPSANSVFAKVLIKMGYYFEFETYHHMAETMLQRMQQSAAEQPSGYANWMQALLWKQYGFRQVILSGEQAFVVKRAINKSYIPNSIVVALSKESTLPLLKEKTPGTLTSIFVCTDKTCSLPQQTVEEALHLIHSF
jgi:uncharacterized protein YyaL (SSP411 family)